MPETILTEENSPYWQIVDPILQSALQSVDPYQCTLRNVTVEGDRLKIGGAFFHLSKIGKIYLVGAGKAVVPMTRAVLQQLGDRVYAGLLIGKHEDAQFKQKWAPKIDYLLGSHPVLSALSLESTRRLVKFLKKTTEKDLVICLISGGGSALMSLPYDPISLEDMEETTRQLLFSGANINEVNTIRKHIDRIKGGGLARLAAPAALTTLVLSDVIGDALDAIASGPTVADPSTFQDAWQIINRYYLEGKLPSSVVDRIQKGEKGEIEETVKPGESCLEKTTTTIIGSLEIATQVASRKAQECGFQTVLLDTALKGEAHEKGRELAEFIRKKAEEQKSSDKPVCFITGGETTVTVRGSGLGGRNQETALSAAMRLDGLKNCLFISLATDGEDGPTDAAGAAVDGSTLQKGKQAGMDAVDFLKCNDAYHYLEKTDSLIKTGPTGTNVNDLVLMFLFNK